MTVKDLNIAQVGEESSWGTKVAQTAKLMGLIDCRLIPTVNAKVFPDIRGNLAPGHVASLTGQAGAARVEQIALYEDILFPLESLFGMDTPSGSDPYTYEYAAPLAAAVSSPYIMTLARGQGSHIWALAGGLVNAFTLRGEAGENDTELTVSYDLIGKQVDEDALDSLSDRTVNPIMSSHGALFIDAWGGTIGSTAVSDVLWSFELSLNANRNLQHYVGALSPGNWAGHRWEAGNNTLRLSMDMQAGGTANDIIDAIVGASAVVQRQIRLKFSNTANLDLQIDFAGTIVGAPELVQDRDGVDSVDLTFQGTYNSTLANWLKIQAINGLSARP